jgi:MurNAc alpha-1-phosphate uridylyltransferase
LRIAYSYEGAEPLETGGGMLHAKPLLGDDPFVAVNGDIFTDFDFSTLPRNPAGLAHLVLVDNPAHHPQGDFGLEHGLVFDKPRLTFAGIGVYRHELLAARAPGKFGITPILRAVMGEGAISGEHYRGAWSDVGTVERLNAIDAQLVRNFRAQP